MSWSGIYRGVVRSTADPLQQGRVRLQVAQVTGTALTAWAPPAQTGGAPPSVGQQVWVMYEGGDVSYPTYIPPIPAPPLMTLVQDWTQPLLAVGYTHNGNGTPEYRVVNVLGSLKVEWQGGINIPYSSGSIGNSGLFLADPLAIIPTTLRTVTCACSVTSSTTASLRIDFQTDGTAKILGTNTSTINPPWLSLCDVNYYL